MDPGEGDAQSELRASGGQPQSLVHLGKAKASIRPGLEPCRRSLRGAKVVSRMLVMKVWHAGVGFTPLFWLCKDCRARGQTHRVAAQERHPGASNEFTH